MFKCLMEHSGNREMISGAAHRAVVYFASLELLGFYGHIAASRYLDGVVIHYLPLWVAYAVIVYLALLKAETFSHGEIAYVSVASSAIFVLVLSILLGFGFHLGLDSGHTPGLEVFFLGHIGESFLIVTVGVFLLLCAMRMGGATHRTVVYFASLGTLGTQGHLVMSLYLEAIRFLPVLVAFAAIVYLAFLKAKTFSHGEIAYVSVASSTIYVLVNSMLNFSYYLPGLVKGLPPGLEGFISVHNIERLCAVLLDITILHFLLLYTMRKWLFVFPAALIFVFVVVG